MRKAVSAAAFGKARALGEDRDNRSDFERICIGGTDSNQREVTDVYANQVGRYAVYQTPQRVVILFAEDPLVQRSQRKRLAPLASLRSTINGSLEDWRSRSQAYSRLPQGARQFDMRVGSALVEALEGDADAGLEILKQVESDIANEKASRARLSYLVWTMTSALAFALLFSIAYGFVSGWDVPSDVDRRALHSILHATLAGVLGTVYSIALGIKNREIRNDQRRLDHITDAVVRISIGVLAAFVFETFLLSGAIQVSFGNGVPLAGGAGVGGVHQTNWPIELIAGFLAGFAERLVPDLLGSYAIAKRDADPPRASPSAPSETKAVRPATVANEYADDPEVPDPHAEDDDEDGCDVELADPRFLTPDEALPAASGGVARE